MSCGRIISQGPSKFTNVNGIKVDVALGNGGIAFLFAFVFVFALVLAFALALVFVFALVLAPAFALASVVAAFSLAALAGCDDEDGSSSLLSSNDPVIRNESKVDKVRSDSGFVCTFTESETVDLSSSLLLV